MNSHDAHCHPHGRLDGTDWSVVNGTEPEDWHEVLGLAEKQAKVIAAIGLHPWKLANAPDDWKDRFTRLIDRAGAVGEIGLDQWVEGADPVQQESAFRWQLEQAAERNLPVSIHCLKAGDALLHILKQCARPSRGIHLHAFSGSPEEAEQFCELNAYFSFHAGQFKANAKKAPAAVQILPPDRLLIETDAPETLNDHTDRADFLRMGYATVAKLRETEVEALADQISANFERYFLNE